MTGYYAPYMTQRWSYTFEASDPTGARIRAAAAREDESAGDRDCARAEFCASAKRERLDDGSLKITPAASYQTFCFADRGIIAECLAEIPHTYVRLSIAVRQHYTSEKTVHMPFGPSIPLNATADELARLLVDAVCSWHERVAQVARLSGPDTCDWHERSLGVYAARLLVASVPVLSAHVDVLLGLQAEAMVRPRCSPVARTGTVLAEHGDTILVSAGGSDAGLELLRLDFLARAALQETKPAPVRFIGVPCRSCQKNALQLAAPAQHDGDQQFYSICIICRDVMDEITFHAWTKAWANYYGNRVTPAMAAAR